MPTPTLCLMLKAPRLGGVKTRLARDIGASAALAAYRALVEHQLLAIPEGWNVEIHFTPDDAAGEMRAWLQPLRKTPIHFRPQVSGDLGDRLKAALADMWSRCSQTILFAGGDCPALDATALQSAADNLTRFDVVIIPAHDGGYVLIGFHGYHPTVFDNITWSTASVLPETLQRIATLGISHTLLASMEDVDDIASWERANQPSLFK